MTRAREQAQAVERVKAKVARWNLNVGDNARINVKLEDVRLLLSLATDGGWRDVLKPFASERLSTEPGVSDLLHRSPAEEMRRHAKAIEQRDAHILAARALLETDHG